jgi:hypothetical protein
MGVAPGAFDQPPDPARPVGKDGSGARLGHSSAVTTLNTYSHLWPDSDDRTRAAVDDVLRTAADLWAPDRASRSKSPGQRLWPGLPWQTLYLLVPTNSSCCRTQRRPSVAHSSTTAALTGSGAPRSAGSAATAAAFFAWPAVISFGSMSPMARMSAQVNHTPRCCLPSGPAMRWCGIHRAVTQRFSQVSLMFSNCAASARCSGGGWRTVLRSPAEWSGAPFSVAITLGLVPRQATFAFSAGGWRVVAAEDCSCGGDEAAEGTAASTRVAAPTFSAWPSAGQAQGVLAALDKCRRGDPAAPWVWSDGA